MRRVSLLATFFPFCWVKGVDGLSISKAAEKSPTTWKPKVSSLEERRSLRGLKHESEKIGSLGFHHIEFYCGDAKSTASQFSSALGMRSCGLTGQSTGNDKCVSYGLESGNFRLLITAPYSQVCSSATPTNKEETNDYDAPNPLPHFSPSDAHDFFLKHGLAARAIGLEVVDAKVAFENSVANGAQPILEPTFVPTCRGQINSGVKSKGCFMSEVNLYGDVVLRYVSFVDAEGKASLSQTPESQMRIPFLPHLSPVEGYLSERESYGIQRIDHAVGNVPDLLQTHNYVSKFTGFHDFAEFTSEDVGTVDSGLNSVVLASDSEDVLLPLNEPTEGKRKSQIQTYLEQNEGPGLQHLALKTSDIFETVTKMREAEKMLFGFELMARPSDAYYLELPDRLGDQLTPTQYEKLEELGILADADDEGVLLQLFTKPVGDRPTFFIEIIQRIGCWYTPDGAESKTIERPGCGGFGQGNFRELFRAIEEHEKTLKV